MLQDDHICVSNEAACDNNSDLLNKIKLNFNAIENIVDTYDLNINREKIETMGSSQWLNSEVIRVFQTCICMHVRAMCTLKFTK